MERIFKEPLAQLVEHWIFNPGAVGSIPTRLMQEGTMRLGDMEELFNEQVDKEWDILIQRGNAYADEDDRLSNFKKVAEVWGMTPLEYTMIHIVDKLMRLQRAIKGVEKVAPESVEDYIIDARNYLFLLWCLVTELWTGNNWIPENEEEE